MKNSIRTLMFLMVAIFNLIIIENALAFSWSGDVRGTSAIWFANQPDGTSFHGDVAPTNSPVAIDVSSISGGSFLYFNVSGSTSRSPDLISYPLVGGDGEPPSTGNWTVSSPFSLISGMSGPFSSLVGVFIDSHQTFATPVSLSFLNESSKSFSVLSPSMQQVFFIGDGLTGVGIGDRQKFQVPNGADILYLGTFDYPDSNNNVGMLHVTTTVVPEPISSILFVTGGTLLAGRRFLRRKA